MLLLCFESDFCGPPPRPGLGCGGGPITPAQARDSRQAKARTEGGDSRRAPSPGPGTQAKGGGVKRGPAAATRRRPAARQPGSGGEIPSVLGSQANGSAPPTQSFARIRNDKNRQNGPTRKSATKRRAYRVPPEIVNLINTGFRFSGKFQGLIYRCRAGKQQVFRSCQLN